MCVNLVFLGGNVSLIFFILSLMTCGVIEGLPISLAIFFRFLFDLAPELLTSFSSLVSKFPLLIERGLGVNDDYFSDELSSSDSIESSIRF